MPRNGLVRAAYAAGRGVVRIDGGCTALPIRPRAARERPGAAVARRDDPPGPLPPLAGPDLQRDGRAGGRGRDAPQRGARRARSRTRSCSRPRAAPARRRSRGSSPRRSTARTSAPTRTPATPAPSCVSIREGRALDLIEIDAASNRGIDDDPRAPRAAQLRPDRPAAQGLHPRRGAPDHEGRLERAPQVARGAARLRDLHVREHASPASSRRRSCRASSGSTSGGCRCPRSAASWTRILDADGREADPEAIALVARLAAGGMRDAESILDQLLSPRPATAIEADAVRDLLGLADAELVDGFVDALATRRRRRRDRPPRPARGARPRPPDLPRPGRRRHPRAAARRARPPARRRTRPRGRRPAPRVHRSRRALGPGGLRLQLELALLGARRRRRRRRRSRRARRRRGPRRTRGRTAPARETAAPARRPRPVATPRRGRGRARDAPQPATRPGRPAGASLRAARRAAPVEARAAPRSRRPTRRSPLAPIGRRPATTSSASASGWPTIVATISDATRRSSR